MSIFLRRVPRHLVLIDPLNATNKDWLILIEAGTIVGPSNERIRVARATQERKVVTSRSFISLDPSLDPNSQALIRPDDTK